MARPGLRTPYECVRAATSAFEAYLQENALPVHYIQVRHPDYPIRRVDHEMGLSPFREDQIKSTFKWSEAQRRWTRKDGGILVAEAEIWQVIQYFIMGTVQASAIDLCNMIDEEVEGVYFGDVHKAWRLWQDSGLSRAEFSQGVRWVGRKPPKLSGPYGRSPPKASMISAFATSSSTAPSSTARNRCHDTQLGMERSTVATSAMPYFHPSRPDVFHVGNSYRDGNHVWATFVGEEKQQLRYLNHTLGVVSVKDLDIIWHPQLDLGLFEGEHKREKERARRQHIIKLIESNIASSSNTGGHTSRPCTPSSMILRPRPPLSTRKRRRTTMDTPLELSNSNVISDTDESLSSPRRLLDMTEARRSKKACGEEALPQLRASPAPIRRPLTSNFQLNKSGRATGHANDRATGARVIDHVTHDHSINHPTEASMTDHVTHDHTNDHATHDHTSQLPTDASMIDHATHDHTDDHATHDHTSHLPTNASMFDHTTYEYGVDHATKSPIDRAEGQGVTSEGIIRTVLRVFTSNQPTKAPINILLGNCRDVEEFYSYILSQCTSWANQLHEVSAVFSWNRRGNLIRKGNHEDWSFFYKDLQRSWKRDVEKFIDGICEIEIMLHMES